MPGNAATAGWIEVGKARGDSAAMRDADAVLHEDADAIKRWKPALRLHRLFKARIVMMG